MSRARTKEPAFFSSTHLPLYRTSILLGQECLLLYRNTQTMMPFGLLQQWRCFLEPLEESDRLVSSHSPLVPCLQLIAYRYSRLAQSGRPHRPAQMSDPD